MLNKMVCGIALALVRLSDILCKLAQTYDVFNE